MSGPGWRAGRTGDRVRRSLADRIRGFWEGFPGEVMHESRPEWVEGDSKVEGTASAKALGQNHQVYKWDSREVTEPSPGRAWGLQGGFGFYSWPREQWQNMEAIDMC